MRIEFQVRFKCLSLFLSPPTDGSGFASNSKRPHNLVAQGDGHNWGHSLFAFLAVTQLSRFPILDGVGNTGSWSTTVMASRNIKEERSDALNDFRRDSGDHSMFDPCQEGRECHGLLGPTPGPLSDLHSRSFASE